MPAARAQTVRPKDAAVGLTAYLGDQLAELARSLPKAAKKAKPKPVHNARVAARRLSAALDLVEPLVAKKRLKPLRRLAKDVRAALSELRDADAMAETLERLRPAAAVRTAIDAGLAHHHDKSTKKARRKLERLKRKVDRHDAKKLMKHLVAGAVVACVREAAYASLDAIIAAVAAASVSRTSLHPARVAAKRLRYALELAVVIGVPVAATLVDRVKVAQDQLGAWHDATVLAEFILRHAAKDDALAADTAGSAALVRFADRVAATAARHRKSFVQHWGATGATLAHSIRRALPLDVTRS